MRTVKSSNTKSCKCEECKEIRRDVKRKAIKREADKEIKSAFKTVEEYAGAYR